MRRAPSRRPPRTLGKRTDPRPGIELHVIPDVHRHPRAGQRNAPREKRNPFLMPTDPHRLIDALFADVVSARATTTQLIRLNAALGEVATGLRDLLSERASGEPGTAEHDVTVALALRQLMSRPLDEIIQGAILDNPASA